MKRLPTTISESEFLKLLETVKDPQRKLAFALGFYEGMRVSEVCNLLPEHVEYDMRLIRIKNSKFDKDRNIPIMPEVLKGLKHLPIGVGPRALQISFKNAAKKALGKDLHFHVLRHSSATWLLNVKKWSTRQVQVFLGHSRVSTTEIYTHVQPQDLINLVWGEKRS